MNQQNRIISAVFLANFCCSDYFWSEVEEMLASGHTTTTFDKNMLVSQSSSAFSPFGTTQAPFPVNPPA